MSEIVIRRAAAEDIPALVRLEAEAFADPWMERALSEAVSDQRWLTLLAQAGDRVCGYGAAWVVLDEGEIARLAVASELRREGIGRRLTNALIEGCAQRGARKLFLEVRASNQAARQLYEMMSFVVCGSRRGYYSNREDAILMVHEVSGC